MNTALVPTWQLTTEHPWSDREHPVLICTENPDVAYRAGDLVNFPLCLGGIQLATQFVGRFGGRLTGADRKLVERFLADGPQGPHVSD